MYVVVTQNISEGYSKSFKVELGNKGKVEQWWENT